MAGHWWLMHFLAIQEAEIRRITVKASPRQIVYENLSQKIFHNNRTGGVAQGEGPEFERQHDTHTKRFLVMVS
jgi:hypothetical protein